MNHWDARDTESLSIVTLAALLGGIGVAIVLVLAVSKGLERVGRLESAQTALSAKVAQSVPAHTSGDCAAPEKSGDRTVIVVRREGERIVTHCNRLADWRDPARTLKDNPQPVPKAKP